MWYLVVPPIVVIVCLAFLVWYLSRKESDPAIAEKVLQRNQERLTVSFPRTKEFFLKLLEKSGQRIKLMFLRLHNAFHGFTQSVKASRQRVRTAMTSVTETKAVILDEAPLAEPTWKRLERKVHDVVPSFASKSPRDSTPEAVTEREPKVVSRPMVSAIMAQPEQEKSQRGSDTAYEEELIARIARDPKDFTAYETLGDHYLEKENIRDAKECYRQVLKLSPVHRLVKIKIRRLEKLLTKAGE